MKYLRAYENWKHEDEYVLINTEDLVDDVKRELPYEAKPPNTMLFGQVVAVDGADNPIVLFSNGYECLIAKEDVVDGMTDEEIESFKMEQETEKYNI